MESVIDLDLSEVEIRRIPLSDGTALLMDRPLVLEPRLSDDRQLFEATDRDSGIDAYGETREELLESIFDDVDAIWHHYVEGKGQFTDEAAKIGQWWREHAHREKKG